MHLSLDDEKKDLFKILMYILCGIHKRITVYEIRGFDISLERNKIMYNMDYFSCFPHLEVINSYCEYARMNVAVRRPDKAGLKKILFRVEWSQHFFLFLNYQNCSP